MRRHQTVTAALLALALLLGQWFAAAHDGEHATAATADCAVCVYAHDLGGGALPWIPHVALDARVAAPVSATAPPMPATARHQYPIRGPPALLA